MQHLYLVDFRCDISVLAIFSCGIAVLGTPQCPPPEHREMSPEGFALSFSILKCFYCACTKATSSRRCPPDKDKPGISITLQS